MATTSDQAVTVRIDVDASAALRKLDEVSSMLDHIARRAVGVARDVDRINNKTPDATGEEA